MRAHHIPITVPTVIADPIPLLDDEFDRYDPLQAYGEGFVAQGGMAHDTTTDTEEK